MTDTVLICVGCNENVYGDKIEIRGAFSCCDHCGTARCIVCGNDGAKNCTACGANNRTISNHVDTWVVPPDARNPYGILSRYNGGH